MLKDAFFAIWFLLPAGIANVAPILAAKMPGLKKYDAPIDGGARWHGHRLLGNHKTWRGVIAGVLLATLILVVQQALYIQYDWARFISGGVDYAALPVLILGPAFAIGALGGDALESFFKRRRGINSGKPWFFFDQLDYIIGAIVLSLPFVRAEPFQYLLMIVIWFVLHLVSSYVGWLTKFKDAPI